MAIWIWGHSAQLLRVSPLEQLLGKHLLLFAGVESLKVVDDADLVAPLPVATVDFLSLLYLTHRTSFLF